MQKLVLLLLAAEIALPAFAAKDQQSESAESGLTTWGEFGPILTTVPVDAAQKTMGWSHWEQGAAGPRAVFSYAAPKAKSHYVEKPEFAVTWRAAHPALPQPACLSPGLHGVF